MEAPQTGNINPLTTKDTKEHKGQDCQNRRNCQKRKLKSKNFNRKGRKARKGKIWFFAFPITAMTRDVGDSGDPTPLCPLW
jgi:hypothetical protein